MQNTPYLINASKPGCAAGAARLYGYCTLSAAFSQAENRLTAINCAKGETGEKQKSVKILNFPPIIVYTIFVQVAIDFSKKFGQFSANLLSIFLTIHWKFRLQSVIMDYANMIYVMHTSKTHLGGKL